MTSLMTAGEAINQYVFPRSPMFENNVEVWTSNNFQRYTINSIIISTITVLGVLLTSIPAAYSFARIEFPFKNLIFYLLLLSLMIPEIITLLPHLLIIRGEIIPLPFGPTWMNTLQGLTVPFMGNIFWTRLYRNCAADRKAYKQVFWSHKRTSTFWLDICCPSNGGSLSCF